MSWGTSFSSEVSEAIEKGEVAPYGGAIIPDDSLEKLLLDIQMLPILEEERANLINQVQALKDTCGNVGEQVANLNQQIDKYKQLLEIEREKTKLEHDRAEFYKEQGISKDKLVEQYSVLNDKLIKEAEKKTFWKTIGIGAIVGLIVKVILSL